MTLGNVKGSAQALRVRTDILGETCHSRPTALAEQHRIVEEIESQLTRLDAGVAALKRVQANLKRYRAAVLKAACEGRLVPTEADLARREGRPYEPASALLARIAASNAIAAKAPRDTKEPHDKDPVGVADPSWLPEGWEPAPLGALTRLIRDVDHRMPKQFVGGLPYVSSRDFTGHNGINFEAAKTISPADFAQLAKKIQPRLGDLLLSRYGTVGLVRHVTDDRPFLASYSAAVIKTLELPILNSYLAIALRSEPLQLQMRKGIRASAQPDLGLASIRELVVPVPPLAEQHRIVAEVDRRFSIVDDLDRVAPANLSRATRLRQTLLSSAFLGWPGVERLGQAPKAGTSLLGMM